MVFEVLGRELPELIPAPGEDFAQRASADGVLEPAGDLVDFVVAEVLNESGVSAVFGIPLPELAMVVLAKREDVAVVADEHSKLVSG